MVYPTITAFESSTLKIAFSFEKQPEKPQVTLISATFTNLSSSTLTNFIFQAAVPKVLELYLHFSFDIFCKLNIPKLNSYNLILDYLVRFGMVLLLDFSLFVLFCVLNCVVWVYCG